MKTWIKATLWTLLGVCTTLTVIALPVIVMAIALKDVQQPSYPHILTAQKVKEKGWDQKTDITFKDWEQDFAQITEIGSSAFENNKNLLTIEVSNNIVIINNYAFKKSSLTRIDFSKGSGLKTIEFSAFENSQLENCNIPPDSLLVSIKNSAFQNTKIKSFHFPLYIKWIAFDAFKDTTLLKDVSFENPDTKDLFIGPGAFTNTAIESFIYTNAQGIIPFNKSISLKSIDFSQAEYIWPTFFSCLLTEIDVIIPNNIREIGLWSFSSSMIKSVDFINYTNQDSLYIGEGVFSFCSNLTKIALPNILNIELDTLAFQDSYFVDISMPSYLKYDSLDALYGFTQEQWDLIKWI